MKEILYRAKAINRNPNMNYRTNYQNGDWVYGLISRLEEDYDICEMTDKSGVSGIDVDRKTICEYTGLTDKNGNKVFEGDIVRTQAYRTKAYSKSAKEKRFIGVVKYFEHKWNGTDKRFVNHVFENGYRVEIIGDMENFTHGGWSDFWDCEIIGNIYDNPELLEK